MSSDIDFGELQEDSREKRLRPDQNRQLTVLEVGQLREGELPIFVDLDAARDMEEHALSDKSVELGGVMLGYFCEDEQGHPFVIVCDSLRAAHYESTRGSFKFTHETWEAITRTREQFPAELQMVGWYHTHPDWGVFLSGMDLFICDNFFNKPLDVALVIDPCRRDRGFFQWTTGRKPRTQQTGGYYLTTSRHREYELQQFADSLTKPEGAESMAAPTRMGSSAGGSSNMPQVHLHQSPPPPPPPMWQQVIPQMGMFLQLALLAVLVWKIAAPPAELASNASLSAAAVSDDEMKSIVAELKREMAETSSRVRSETRSEIYDDLLQEMRGSEPGFVERLEQKYDHSKSLETALKSQQLLIAELQKREAETKRLAAEAAEKAEEQIASLTNRRDQLEEEKSELQLAIAKLRAEESTASPASEEVASEVAAKPTTDEETAEQPRDDTLWWLLGIGGGGLIAAVIGFVMRRRKAGDDSAATATSGGRMKNEPTTMDKKDRDSRDVNQASAKDSKSDVATKSGASSDVGGDV